MGRGPAAPWRRRTRRWRRRRGPTPSVAGLPGTATALSEGHTGSSVAGRRCGTLSEDVGVRSGADGRSLGSGAESGPNSPARVRSRENFVSWAMISRRLRSPVGRCAGLCYGCECAGELLTPFDGSFRNGPALSARGSRVLDIGNSVDDDEHQLTWEARRDQWNGAAGRISTVRSHRPERSVDIRPRCRDLAAAARRVRGALLPPVPGRRAHRRRGLPGRLPGRDLGAGRPGRPQGRPAGALRRRRDGPHHRRGPPARRRDSALRAAGPAVPRLRLADRRGGGHRRAVRAERAARARGAAPQCAPQPGGGRRRRGVRAGGRRTGPAARLGRRAVTGAGRYGVAAGDRGRGGPGRGRDAVRGVRRPGRVRPGPARHTRDHGGGRRSGPAACGPRPGERSGRT